MRAGLAAVAVVLPAVRTMVDAADALADLASRFGLRSTGVADLGEWELTADVSLRRFGVGIVVEHDPARSPTWPDVLVVAAHLGPVSLSATREREWPFGRDPEVPADFDCALGGPLGDDARNPIVMDETHHHSYEELRAAGFLS